MAGSPIECFTVADDEIVCFDGTRVLRQDGLPPNHESVIAGSTIRTLPRPLGARLATIATVNDCHFGETVCGLIEGTDIGPVLSSPGGEEPYPEVMNRAVAAEISALDPAIVVAKGDLTATGRREEFQAFDACYQSLLGRLIVTRGNHDNPAGRAAFTCPPVQAVEVPGAVVAVVDTSRPGRPGGSLDRAQLEWLDEVARCSALPVLVFGHHPVTISGSPVLRPDLSLDTASTAALIKVVARRPTLAGYFAGHTHRNRVHRSPGTGAVPFAEVAAVKDFPGSWAEYRVFEGGILAIHRRVSTDQVALDWSEQCRSLYGGRYPAYALGHLDDRCYQVC